VDTVTKSNGHPRVVRSIGDGKYMVIDATVRDARIDQIFEPVAVRVRERGQAIARELRSSSSPRR
jgi:hypothetical protein